MLRDAARALATAVVMLAAAAGGPPPVAAAAVGKKVCVQAVRAEAVVGRSSFELPAQERAFLRLSDAEQQAWAKRQQASEAIAYRDLLASGHYLPVAPPTPLQDGAGWAMELLFGLPRWNVTAEVFYRGIVLPYYRELGWEERPEYPDVVVYRTGATPGHVAVAAKGCTGCEYTKDGQGSYLFHWHPGTVFGILHPSARDPLERHGTRSFHRLDDRRYDRLELRLVDATAVCSAEAVRGPRALAVRGSTVAVEPVVDLAVVFDTTGSMQSSIDSVRTQAVQVIRELAARSRDLRLALVAFRDFDDDPATALATWPFSGDVGAQLAIMNGWTADAGGDTPEDQYAAIVAALGLGWRRTAADGSAITKLVVVISDAPSKDPDRSGNTALTVAAAAEAVDPAHLYPIVVGGDAQAHEAARRLAEMTGGAALSAGSGGEVASALVSAVRRGIEEHASPVGLPETPPLPAGETMARIAGLGAAALFSLMLGALFLVLGRPA